MQFITRKCRNRFCSNLQRIIITLLSIDSQLLINFEILVLCIFRLFRALIDLEIFTQLNRLITSNFQKVLLTRLSTFLQRLTLKLWFRIFSTLTVLLGFFHYCMEFIVTRKPWKGFCSNFPKKNIKTLSIVSQNIYRLWRIFTFLSSSTFGFDFLLLLHILLEGHSTERSTKNPKIWKTICGNVLYITWKRKHWSLMCKKV